MIKNYLKIAWRNFIKNRVSSSINTGGLAVGIAVAMLIALWIWDELSFDKYHQNYEHIAQVMQTQTFNNEINTGKNIPIPLGSELEKSYGSDFKRIVLSTKAGDHILSVGDKKISMSGSFMQRDAPEMFSLKMLKGGRNGLNDPSSILISQSESRALFGETEPLNKTVLFDNSTSFKVTGVYDDPPQNTTFHELGISFIAPWDYYVSTKLKNRRLDSWGDNSFQLFVQTADHTEIAKISEKIKNAKLNKVGKDDAKYKPVLFLQPMSKWHLYSKFKNGVNTGGKIQYVWLFGIIGLFVLFLACINFMNLSTARSEKRAREVGIRKAVGSLRGQLIIQFFCESLLVTTFAFALSLLLVSLVLPFFNNVAGKNMSIPWANPVFWVLGFGFSFFTGIVAGSYPALYLSSFKPVKVLKGAFRTGRFGATPRKVLVVVQFSVSIILIIATIIVFEQVQFAKNRPVGYSRDGLVNIDMATDNLHKQFEALRADLLTSGAVKELAESSSPATYVNNNTSGIEWNGKEPGQSDDFAMIGVTIQYGKTMGWDFTDGRDFSTKFVTDSSGIVLNEAAVSYMRLKKPVGETVKFWGKEYKVVGVIKNMVMESPYEPAKQTVFYINSHIGGFLNIRINPGVSTHEALGKIEKIYKTYAPSAPFSYLFADDEYEKKFFDEERLGKLASSFSVLAIFISCLGLFGMALFVAEQRIKEIGVRKVLGASVFNLWGLLSKDFVILVVISLLIATPISYFFMHKWLQNYQYHAAITWWIFALTAVGAVVITLLTVSYQSIKAALANPINSLKTE